MAVRSCLCVRRVVVICVIVGLGVFCMGIWFGWLVDVVIRMCIVASREVCLLWEVFLCVLSCSVLSLYFPVSVCHVGVIFRLLRNCVVARV